MSCKSPRIIAGLRIVMWHSPSNGRRSTSSSRHSALVSTRKFPRPFEHAVMVSYCNFASGLPLRPPTRTPNTFRHPGRQADDPSLRPTLGNSAYIRPQPQSEAVGVLSIENRPAPSYHANGTFFIACTLSPLKHHPLDLPHTAVVPAPIRLGVAPVLSLLRRQVQQL